MDAAMSDMPKDDAAFEAAVEIPEDAALSMEDGFDKDAALVESFISLDSARVVAEDVS